MPYIQDDAGETEHRRPVRHDQRRELQQLPPATCDGAALQDAERVYALVEHHLECGQPKMALRVINNSPCASTDMKLRNAKGVCHLRLGESSLAVALYRPMVLTSYLGMRSDVPLAPKLNFATALFLTGNVNGCLNVLRDIGDDSDPFVRNLRASIDRWKSQLAWHQKLLYALGAQPNHPVARDFVPGVLV